MVEIPRHFDLQEPSQAVSPHPHNPGLVSSADEKVHAVSKRSLCGKTQDFCKALWSSRVFRHILVAVGATLLVGLFVTPPGWMSALVLIPVCLGIFLISVVIRVMLEKKLCEAQQLEIEMKGVSRCAKGGLDCNHIPIKNSKNQIYIGSFPNRAADDLEKLVQQNIKTVLSVTHPEERKQIGYSIPYTEGDYQKAGINLITIDVPDHTLLSVEQMGKANQEIKDALEDGNVFVHCQGGKGRSAQAIAAYLIGTLKMSVEDAQNVILAGRPQSTIKNKNGALTAYHTAINGS